MFPSPLWRSQKLSETLLSLAFKTKPIVFRAVRGHCWLIHLLFLYPIRTAHSESFMTSLLGLVIFVLTSALIYRIVADVFIISQILTVIVVMLVSVNTHQTDMSTSAEKIKHWNYCVHLLDTLYRCLGNLSCLNHLIVWFLVLVI